MSKHSTPIDRKIQKDWAEVMQQFGLPADEISTTGEDLVANIHKESLDKTSKKGLNKFMLAFAGTLALSATALYGTKTTDLSLATLNQLLTATTLSSIAKDKVKTVIASTPLTVKSLVEKVQGTSVNQSDIQKTKGDKPKYITLTKDLDLSALETLSAKDSDLDYDLLDQGNWKTHIVSPKDKLSLVLYKLGIKDAEINQLTSNNKINKELEKITSGTILRAERDRGKLSQLITYQPNSKTSFVISLNDDKYTGQSKQKVIETRQTRSTLFINNSLRFDANQENIPHKIIQLITKIFDRDVKLTRDLKKGDRMTLVYEQIFHRGNKVADGQVLAAELIHENRSHRAIKFTHQDGKVDYFDSKGYDLSNAFVRMPIHNYKRKSSGFGKRRHPVYKRIRMHTGQDFAANKGTPVIATGNGVIAHVARKGGYGKTIIIKHNGGYSTLYAHLSKYEKSIKQGKKIYLGDVIGYVGSTGVSTGNHLHYEFQVNGVPKDPMKVQLPKQLSLTSTERKQFKVDSHNLVRQLDVLQRFAKENVDIKSGFGG